MESIYFEDGTLLHIEDLALAKLFKYIQTEPTSNEAGGILIGKQLVGREEYYLCDISEPTTLDTCSRYSFVRSKISAQKVIDKKWKESNGIENYLGEWHTHPEINPRPSFTDRNLIKQVIADNSNKYKKVFLIIVGMNKSLYIGVANSDISNEISMSMIRSFL